MKFFISHSSQNKPTIKAIISKMPLNIKTWLDEEKLVWGNDLRPAFETAIKQQSDYVILFISESSARSEWVQKEISWALEKERENNRTIVLPICIQSGDEDCAALFPQLGDRKKLILRKFDDLGIEEFAKELASYLFSFICNELSEIYSPSKFNSLRTISSADAIINDYSKDVRKIVFYHREDNPITVDQLFEKFSTNKSINLNREQFDFMLDQISARGMIPGLYFDGFELYLEEEHMAWKTEMEHDAKVMIAKRAAAFVKNNMTVYIDAGSTTAELVKIICNRIQSNNLHNLTVVTCSISHANVIAECCVSKGFDNNNSNIRLELVGGLLRQNTEATVPLTDNEKLSDQHHSFDVAFLGANGASEKGFTVLPNAELQRKSEAFALGVKKVVLCDASKCGITLKAVLASQDDDFTVIMNNKEGETEFDKVHEKFKEKMRLA